MCVYACMHMLVYVFMHIFMYAPRPAWVYACVDIHDWTELWSQTEKSITFGGGCGRGSALHPFVSCIMFTDRYVLHLLGVVTFGWPTLYPSLSPSELCSQTNNCITFGFDGGCGGLLHIYLLLNYVHKYKHHL